MPHPNPYPKNHPNVIKCLGTTFHFGYDMLDCGYAENAQT